MKTGAIPVACPMCASKDTRVASERPIFAGLKIKKMRECNRCGWRRVTLETLAK